MSEDKDVTPNFSVPITGLALSPAWQEQMRQMSELSKTLSKIITPQLTEQMRGMQALATAIQPQIDQQLKISQALIQAIQPQIFTQLDISRNLIKALDIKIPDLSPLINSITQITASSTFISSIDQIRKTQRELTIQATASVVQDTDGVKFEQNSKLDISVKLDSIDKKQDQILAKLDDKPQLAQAIAIVKDAGFEVIPASINKIQNVKSTITINSSVTVIFPPNSLQSTLVNFFFAGVDTLKKKAYELGDLFLELEPDYLNASSAEKRAMKKRWLDTRRQINEKFRLQTGMKADFILLEGNKFVVNQKLLKA